MKLTISYRKGLSAKLFFLLMISTFIGYVGYYLYSKEAGINIYFIYSNYFLSVFDEIDTLSLILRYLKDIVVVLLLFVLIFKMRKSQQPLFMVIGLFVAWGLVVAFINGQEITTIISGIRSYIYFFAVVLFFSGIDDYSLRIKTFRVIIFAGLIINLIVEIDQAMRGTNGVIALAGTGGYRFPGLFGSAGALASYAIGVALFYVVVDVAYEKIGFIKMVIVLVTCVLVANFSGTRSALINILIIIGAWLVFNVGIKKEQRFWFAVVAAVIAVPLVIMFATNMAGRGNILQVQLESGRLLILKNLLLNPSLINLLLGYGIGAGSNTDAILNQTQENAYENILDGTFNVIIYQYGLVGLILSFVLIFIIFRKLSVCNNKIFQFVFIGTILLQALTNNIFETQSLLILLGVVFGLLATNKFELSEKQKMELADEQISV